MTLVRAAPIPNRSITIESTPEVLVSELPHNDPDRVIRVAKNLSLIHWRDIVDCLADVIYGDNDSEISEIVREFNRRI